MMATQSITRMTRSVKKLEKPRPLKLGNQNRHSAIEGSVLRSVEDIMSLADNVALHITNKNYDQLLQTNIITLCSNLKVYGQQMEAIYKDQLDRAFVSFRDGSKDGRLDYPSRVHLLEVIEFRAMQWQINEDVALFYKQLLNKSETISVPDTPQSSGSVTTPVSAGGFSFGVATTPSPTLQPNLLSPGEIIKCSGKYVKPTKIPGKNYYKDEVVIRNSDSGKVMGIKGRRVHMIEELSETIISFQRVNPGAKERLVQITGPSEEEINYARQLIEETIRRNASPIRSEQPEKDVMGGSSSSLNSSASDENNRLTQTGSRRSTLLHSFSTNDATLGDYKYTVTVGSHTIKITGTNPGLVREAKLVLDEYFSGESEKNFALGGDCFSNYEEESVTASAPAQSQNMISVSSQDSGATSDSEETYRIQERETVYDVIDLPLDSPPLTKLTTQKNGMREKMDVKQHQEGFIQSKIEEAADYNQMVVVRQPLFPNASPEAFEQAESSNRSQDVGAKTRRAFFDKTSHKDEGKVVLPKNNYKDQGFCSHKDEGKVVLPKNNYKDQGFCAKTNRSFEGASSKKKYSRNSLLNMATSPLCQATPSDWARIVKECPAILKKSQDFFDPVSYMQRSLEMDTQHLVVSILESDSQEAE